MTLRPFTHGMCGPTWVNAQGFVGALDFFLSRLSLRRLALFVLNMNLSSHRSTTQSGFACRLFQLSCHPGTPPTGHDLPWARFTPGTGVCNGQQETFANSCAGLRSLPPAATLEAHQHSMSVLTTAAEAVFGPPSTPDTVPGLVSRAARVLHALLQAHRRLWLNAPLVRKVIATRRAISQAWEVVGLGRSLEVFQLAPPGGLRVPPSQTTVVS